MTGAALELRRTDVPAAFADQMHMAKVLSESTLLPAHLRGRAANVLVVLQGARALDVSAFWAFQSMHVIEGKLGMAAELMRALVIRSGHSVRVVERSMTRAVVEVKRHDRDEPYRAEFTWEDAKAAKLTEKENWRKYPKSMLVARATAIAVRDECPDVLFGVVYTPDELGVITDDDGNPLAEAQLVDPLTPDEIQEHLAAIASADLADLPRIWTVVVERGGQFAKVADGMDDTLFEALSHRLGVEAHAALDRAAVRDLWELGRTLRCLGGTVNIVSEVDGERRVEPVELGAYLRRRGSELPEDAAPADEVVEGEVVEPAATEHAQQMQEAAAASWGTEDRERLLAAREEVFDRLSKRGSGDSERPE